MQYCSDLHIHTLASHHAYSTLLENIVYAKKAGLSLIAITDLALWKSDYLAPSHGRNYCAPRCRGKYYGHGGAYRPNSLRLKMP